MTDLVQGQYKGKAIVVDSIGAQYTLQDVEIDASDLGEEEILIRMHASGICHTDILIAEGNLPCSFFPTILGHEGCGTVVALGKGNEHQVAVGDEVMLSFSSCGTCTSCVETAPALCSSFYQRNFLRQSPGRNDRIKSQGKVLSSKLFGQSSFASLTVVDTNSVVKLPVGAKLQPEMAPFGCGIQTGAGSVFNILASVSITPSQRSLSNHTLVVFGAGAVGLAAIMAGKLVGYGALVVVDVKPGRLSLARSLGATHTIDSLVERNVPEKIREVSLEEDGPKSVFEATGIPTVVDQALRSVGTHGTLLSAGSPGPGKTVNVEIDLFVRNTMSWRGTIEGHCDPRKLLPELVSLFLAGQFPVDKMMKTYRASDFATAVRDMQSGATVKPILLWE
ncbi:GroES-like protein [Acaromyces ingoldii]|uniref:GroES-like protein n=1 Tax=Acaromyces ingoldii TaxID=215250 RepID=A0A316YA42_9BASI|nr:GroES-like protein [Acaromyces ingoldii]PWN86730.1 GroES-like protein [Acaromyces ingoldii]